MGIFGVSCLRRSTHKIKSIFGTCCLKQLTPKIPIFDASYLGRPTQKIEKQGMQNKNSGDDGA
jgi:hypothetical protein